MDNKKVLVLGIAKSGYEASKLLKKKEYDVIVNDISINHDDSQIKELETLGCKVIIGSHPDDLLDNTYSMIVKNPGISNNHKYVIEAKKYNIPVINELELAHKYFPSNIKIIGITGTNGKTTVSTLIYNILKESGKTVHLMGNIGFPACTFIDKINEGDILVIEVSDHQLCNVLNFKTNISILTNLSEAHLDFHGTYDKYKSVKKRIFNNHTSNDIAIINGGDEDVISLTNDILSSKKYFSAKTIINQDCYLKDEYIFYKDEKIIKTGNILIKGIHNYENIMTSIIAVKEFNVDNNVINKVLKKFSGVEHRLEFVREVNGIYFYNDSKSTNVVSTIIAVNSFSDPIILLLGGLDRGNSFLEFKNRFKNVIMIISYGEVKNRIKQFADDVGIMCEVVDNLEDATFLAFNKSVMGNVILLSPACASWDHFKNFEERGNRFKEYVNKL